jgi:hypothetical protein
VQVAGIDHVEVDKADRADSRGGKIHGCRRAQPAGADTQHTGRLELALPLEADFRHDEMPAVALHLVAGQILGLAHRRPGTAGNRRHDADRVPRLERRLLAIEMADVLVVDVDVDEAAQPAVVVVQMAAEIPVFADEPLQRVANGRPVDLHDVLLAGERT